jgi:hypothetical protein
VVAHVVMRDGLRSRFLLLVLLNLMQVQLDDRPRRGSMYIVLLLAKT